MSRTHYMLYRAVQIVQPCTQALGVLIAWVVHASAQFDYLIFKHFNRLAILKWLLQLRFIISLHMHWNEDAWEKQLNQFRLMLCVWHMCTGCNTQTGNVTTPMQYGESIISYDELKQCCISSCPYMHILVLTRYLDFRTLITSAEPQIEDKQCLATKERKQFQRRYHSVNHKFSVELCWIKENLTVKLTQSNQEWILTAVNAVHTILTQPCKQRGGKCIRRVLIRPNFSRQVIIIIALQYAHEKEKREWTLD